MGNDVDSILPVRGFNLNYSVKATCSAERARQASKIICRGEDKYFFAFRFVNAGLYSNIFFRIGVMFITVCELIHIVQVDNRRCICNSLIKGCFDFFDKIAIRLVLAANERRSLARLNNRTCHQRFTDPRLAMKEQSSGSRNTELIINITISEGICNLLKFFLGSGIADNHIKLAHRKILAFN